VEIFRTFITTRRKISIASISQLGIGNDQMKLITYDTGATSKGITFTRSFTKIG